jgi:hypothetical protein
LGLIIGDCVHNLRACLDHLAYQLAILGKGGVLDEQEARSVTFPIYTKPETFRNNKRRIGLLRPQEQTRMEELQPYNASETSIWGPFPYVPALLPSTLDSMARFARERGG